jgi:hypothetical protein
MKGKYMNQLQIFKNSEFGEIRAECVMSGNIVVKADYFIGGFKIDRFELLSCAINQSDRQTALSILRSASMMYHCQDDNTFNTLYEAAIETIVRKFDKNEFYYQGVFSKNVSTILGKNAHIIKRKGDNRNIPDAWVNMSGNDYPVEVKLHKFDKSALDQLQRYISNYECIGGIAVGETLTTDLPKNIVFVSLDQLMLAENNSSAK